MKRGGGGGGNKIVVTKGVVFLNLPPSDYRRAHTTICSAVVQQFAQTQLLLTTRNWLVPESHLFFFFSAVFTNKIFLSSRGFNFYTLA
jgi:hypothetical protein